MIKFTRSAVRPDWAIFESSLVTNYPTKVAQMYGDYLGYFLKHHF